MSLIQQTMTEKNREARRANGRKSRGAATPEGKERSRAAHLRHGLYSTGREEALAALGEDPAALAALIASTHEELAPASDFQARLSERMARLWWRMERAERIQESLMARQVQQHQKRRHDTALKLRYKGIPLIDLLQTMTQDPADPRFYTPRGWFQLFSDAFGDKVKGDQEEILLLLYRLRKPPGRGPGANGPEDSAVPSPPAASPGELAADTYLENLEEMDELFPEPPPASVAVAVGPERDELRGDLIYLAKNELEIAHKVWDPQIEEQERTLPRAEQDEVQAGLHRHADLMRREEESCFRQFMRLGNFLLKLQKGAEKRAKTEGSSGYVDENTETGEMAEVANAESEVANAESEVEKVESEVRSPRSEVKTPESRVAKAETGVQSPKSPAENGEFEGESAASGIKSEGPPKIGRAAA